MTLARLRRTPEQTPAPVRIIHLGLGNFFRAHEAWYTHHAPDAAEWGIAAFTGRRPDAAHALAPQDGLFTLVTRGPEADTLEVITSVSAVHTASDHEALLEYFRDPAVVIVSITATEAGYHFADGHLTAGDPAVAADLAALTADPTSPVVTVPGKLVAGLLARHASGAGPITILPCDNLPGNGEVARTVVTEFAQATYPSLLPWITDEVDFASAMVDRITPAGAQEDGETVRAKLGVDDVSPVRTEPYSEWVIEGAFPGGRPTWEAAGARIVADVSPYEARKLLLLNGAHSLLAYGGTVVGHDRVDQAIADPRCLAWVNQLWDDARASIPLSDDLVTPYREALLERFRNPRMGDALARIAADGSIKIPVRIVPVVTTERAAGRMPSGSARAIAAWVAHLRGLGATVNDISGDSWPQTATGELEPAIQAVLDRLGLGPDPEFTTAVLTAYSELTR